MVLLERAYKIKWGSVMTKVPHGWGKGGAYLGLVLSHDQGATWLRILAIHIGHLMYWPVVMGGGMGMLGT